MTLELERANPEKDERRSNVCSRDPKPWPRGKEKRKKRVSSNRSFRTGGVAKGSTEKRNREIPSSGMEKDSFVMCRGKKGLKRAKRKGPSLLRVEDVEGGDSSQD